MDDYIHPQIIHFADKYCDSSWKPKTELLTFYSLTFVLEGFVCYTVDGTQRTLQKGDIIFISPKSTRTAKTNGFYCIALDFVLEEDDVKMDFQNFTTYGKFTEFKIYFNELKREWLQKNRGYKLKCQALTMLILHKLFYDVKGEDRNLKVEKIKDYIIQNYAKNLNVTMLAHHVNLNPVYCGALFKRHEKMTIGAFINRVRINASLELLFLESNLTITQIAEDVGYTDVYYFSNVFKQLLGVSPSNYRRLAMPQTR